VLSTKRVTRLNVSRLCGLCPKEKYE